MTGVTTIPKNVFALTYRLGEQRYLDSQMGASRTTLIAIGGGELSEASEILETLESELQQRKVKNLVVMTVATSAEKAAADKYKKLFEKLGVKTIDSVDVREREAGFDKESVELLSKADAIFFTGGDQLNITSLLGGTPLHNELHKRTKEGTLIAGSSAGAAMMSGTMISAGKSDSPPRVEGVTIAPGMQLIDGTIIDTHFSQRGRHGRLLTAVAHYPQLLGLGIDERTAAIFTNGKFEVAGEGVVTVVDGSQMKHSDLPYRSREETVGMFGVRVHVLPAGYSFDIEQRKPSAPKLKKMAGNEEPI